MNPHCMFGGVPVPDDNEAEEAIRADERKKCRAELRAKVAEVERIARDDYGSALDELYDFTREAFGGGD